MQRPLLLLPHRFLNNIYVRELGRAYQALGHNVVYSPDNLFESAAAYDLIHLQWPEEQYREYGSGAIEARANAFLQRLDEHKRRGVVLIWTVHNIAPHEHRDSGTDRTVYQGVIDRADVIVHHCQASIQLLASAYRVRSATATVVVPHGNYCGYPDEVDKLIARDRLKLAHDAVVYLHFGSIRGYKGLGMLIRAYRRVRVKRKQLLIAGRYTGEGGISGKLQSLELTLLQRFDPSMRLHLKSIDDRDVQLYLRAADAVVLSHSSGLNSGVAVLGMTFGKLVIGPDIGCIGNTLRQGQNLVYPPNDIKALTRAMESISGIDLDNAAAVNRQVAMGWDWSMIAAKILAAATPCRA